MGKYKITNCLIIVGIYLYVSGISYYKIGVLAQVTDSFAEL